MTRYEILVAGKWQGGTFATKDAVNAAVAVVRQQNPGKEAVVQIKGAKADEKPPGDSKKPSR